MGESLVLDYSKHQNKILELNVEEKYVWVQPGVVLDHLNSFLRPYGLWFPVDVSTRVEQLLEGCQQTIHVGQGLCTMGIWFTTY